MSDAPRNRREHWPVTFFGGANEIGESPFAQKNTRGVHWLNHQKVIELHNGWCMLPMALIEGANPRLVIFFNRNHSQPSPGRITVYDVLMPH